VVHTANLNLTTAIFDNGVRQTYFSGSYNELRDRPTGGGTWSTLAEKPEWTTKISYSNIGPLMHPTTSTNLNVVMSDLITPMFTSTYNLGQDRLRWLHLFSDNVVCNAIRFAQPGLYTTITDFTAERLIYNENLIDLTSADCELLKTDVAKLKTEYAALLSIVNKLSTAPAANNTTFWNSLRRERLATYDGSSNDVYVLYSDRVHCRLQLSLENNPLWRRLLYASVNNIFYIDRSNIRLWGQSIIHIGRRVYRLFSGFDF
jgi:hypothetical protein